MGIRSEGDTSPRLIQPHIATFRLKQQPSDMHSLAQPHSTSIVIQTCIMSHRITQPHATPTSIMQTCTTSHILMHPRSAHMRSPPPSPLQLLFVWLGAERGNRGQERVPPICPSGLCYKRVGRPRARAIIARG